MPPELLQLLMQSTSDPKMQQAIMAAMRQQGPPPSGGMPPSTPFPGPQEMDNPVPPGMMGKLGAGSEQVSNMFPPPPKRFPDPQSLAPLGQTSFPDPTAMDQGMPPGMSDKMSAGSARIGGMFPGPSAPPPPSPSSMPSPSSPPEQTPMDGGTSPTYQVQKGDMGYNIAKGMLPEGTGHGDTMAMLQRIAGMNQGAFSTPGDWSTLQTGAQLQLPSELNPGAGNFGQMQPPLPPPPMPMPMSASMQPGMPQMPQNQGPFPRRPMQAPPRY